MRFMKVGTIVLKTTISVRTAATRPKNLGRMSRRFGRKSLVWTITVTVLLIRNTTSD